MKNAKLDALFLKWQNFTNLERNRMGQKREYRLDRMEKLCQIMGNPQDRLKILHLAGSKGKGSTAVFCSKLLESAGKKVGLYTSPHVLDYRERFQCFPLEPGSEELLYQQANHLDDKLEQLPPGSLPGGDYPTTFEILTLLAFLYFEAASCTWAVMETGLGGRLDATNVVHPQAVLLTPIEREHCDFLGETLLEIATEKAGTIKKGVPVICAPQKEEVKKLFLERTQTLNGEFHYLPQRLDDVESLVSDQGNRVSLHWKEKDAEKHDLSMLGKHQGWNAALALLCLEVLQDKGKVSPISKERQRLALREAQLAGRGQYIAGSPHLLFDGAHTEASIETISQAAMELPGSPRILLFGCADDKDSQAMAKSLKGHWDSVLITTPGTFKTSDPTKVALDFKKAGWPAELMTNTEEAWKRAQDLAGNKGLILVAGSFYLVGIIQSLHKL